MNKRIKSNSIRIIGGLWRGRRLPVLDSRGLRPTTDRVRETLFNWLMHDVNGANCLDVFAGSGVLGLECLSRGAKFVQFVESESQVANALKSNFDALDVPSERVDLIVINALNFLARPAFRRFDLVFLDPPFDSGLLPQILSSLVDNQWLADGALIYVERSSKASDLLVPASFDVYRRAQAGQSCYCLYSS